VFCRMIGDDVGHQRAGQTLCALVWILGQERVERTASAGITTRW
jgi:hypothetical protein